MKHLPEKSSNSAESAAAVWLARRDRDLSPAEQDAYLQWLAEDTAHGTEIARLEHTWSALDQLTHWRPTHSPRPNPDLLAPPRRARSGWFQTCVAAAALLVLGAGFWRAQEFFTPAPRQAVIHPGPERLALDDGSVVELNAGAKVLVHFTPGERRVQLVAGEAHFNVAKDAARPFVVAADKFAVRAIGTAFSVALDREAVSVLVTEGRVQLDETPAALDGPSPGAREVSHLVAGQKIVVSTGPEPLVVSEVQVRDVTPAELERALAWQGLRLEFVDMPLRDVVAEFNRYNVRKLLVDDPGTGALLVGGNFRADNLDSFVRLLDLSFGVAASARGNEIFLQRRR